MSTERKPVAFGDMRNWMKALSAAGEMREIDAEVDWNVELGSVTRLAQGPGTGPALLFKNIKDYNKNTTRCGQVFAGGLGSYRRVAMMMGLPPDTHPRELVKIGRTINEGRIPPRIVKEGPCKENIVTGKAIDLYEFPVPQWNRVDGGRYRVDFREAFAELGRDPPLFREGWQKEFGVKDDSIADGGIARPCRQPDHIADKRR